MITLGVLLQIKRVLLTNDLSEEVLNEAVERDAQLIISYHPLIFPHVKTIVADNWKVQKLDTYHLKF